MKIDFVNIKWKNFLSYGNVFTEVKLDGGNNNLIIGGNGCGKSTLLDALCFALFGKAYRNITKPKLVNTINNKDCVVSLTFKRGADLYEIRRSIKPNAFEILINGKVQDSLAKSNDQQRFLETEILGFSQKTFMQTVVLGSATYQPFMQLSKPARREVLEDLLDITVIGKMADTTRSMITDNNLAVSDTKHNLDLHKKDIEHYKSLISYAKEQEKKSKENLSSRLEELEAESVSLKAQLVKEKHKYDLLAETYQEYLAEKKYQDELSRQISSLENQSSKLENDLCPTCGAEIDNKALLEENSIQLKKLKSCVSVLDNMEAPSKTELHSILASYQYVEKDIQRIQKEQDEMSNSIDIQGHTESLKSSLLKYQSSKQALEKLESKNLHLRKISGILKDDGIRSAILSLFVPKINELVNLYLERMNFNVSFYLDNEFNEEVKSRGRDSFSYYSFSEGEKYRIDLALLFTWREISKLRNSVNTNLLILDEVMDGSLDENGIKDFNALLYDLDQDTTSYIISHNSGFVTKFNTVFEVTKNDGFSSMKNITDTV